MDVSKKNRLKIDVDELANRKVKKRRKRDLNETIYCEVNGKKVPVFTSEFLEENRLIETELRKLRKLNNDFEEHNSVLIKYIDSLNTSCDQICLELNDLTEFKESFATQLMLLRAEIKEKYDLTINENGEQE